MTALLHSCRRLVIFALVIPWLVIAAPFNASAQDWPEIAAERQLVGRWEVWHDNQGQMRQFIQIERRLDGNYIAREGHRYFDEDPTNFREIALRVRQDNGDVIIFDRVGDPHSEAFWVMSEGNLAIEDDEGLIPLFDTRGTQQASVPSADHPTNQRTSQQASTADTNGIDPYRQALVRNYAIEAVRERLVSSQDARFSSLTQTGVHHRGNGLYTVTGFVDSLNRMGAMVRSNWTAEVDCFSPVGSICDVVGVTIRP